MDELDELVLRIIAAGTAPTEDDLRIDRIPSVNLQIAFTDALSKSPKIMRKLEDGNYSAILLPAYANSEEETSEEEFLLSKLIAEFRKLPLESRREPAERYAQLALQLPERYNIGNQFFKEQTKGILVYGVQPIYQRATHGESKAINFLIVQAALFMKDSAVNFLGGEFEQFYSKYAAALTALYAHYSTSTNSVIRTIGNLPELAGRKFIGINANSIDVLLPLDYGYLFAVEDLTKSTKDNIAISVDQDFVHAVPYNLLIMEFLKEKGVTAKRISGQDKLFELHNKKAKQYYSQIGEQLIKGAFAHVLMGASSLSEFAKGYDLELLASYVASQFEVDEIRNLSNSAAMGLDIRQQIKGIALKMGYILPANQQKAGLLLNDLKQQRGNV